MLGLEYKEWQMCHNLKERRTAAVGTRVVWELGIWEWAMGIGSDSGVGMSSRAQTGWQNRTVEAEALVACKKWLCEQGCQPCPLLGLWGGGNWLLHSTTTTCMSAQTHTHTHSCVREARPFWYGMAYTQHTHELYQPEVLHSWFGWT